MNNKAQGTIEYLVIIAIVVVIALVVVGLLLQILGNFGGSNETSLKISWKTAEPWAIEEWAVTDGNLYIVLKNNTADTLKLTSVSVKDTTNIVFTVPTGATTSSIKIGSVTCTGGKYVIPKKDINMVYDNTTTGLTGLKQQGVADIAGSC
ncbi:MAG: class III signal peptide-containing protein [Candidatus Iainarchaeum sp.]|jgi:hypothetical protein